MQRMTPFLTLNGNAQKAMEFYESVFPDSKINKLVLFEENANVSLNGKVFDGRMTILGEELFFLDMPPEYPAPDFTWASTLLLNCKDEEEFDHIFAGLSKDGSVMMGPEPSGNLRKAAWVTDQFGVTWQIVWE